jgi:hypothetical protein
VTLARETGAKPQRQAFIEEKPHAPATDARSRFPPPGMRR